MRSRFRSRTTARVSPGPGWSGASRAGHRLRSVFESGVLAGLLLTAVASAVVGSPTVLFCAVAGAWLVLAAMVGLRNVLDAGCAFMLVVVGVVVIVDVATRGPGSLLP